MRLLSLYFAFIVLLGCQTKNITKNGLLGTYVKKCEYNYIERVTFTKDSVYYSMVSDAGKNKWQGVYTIKGSTIYITYLVHKVNGGFAEDIWGYRIKDGVLISTAKTMFVNLKGASESEKQKYIECIDGDFVKKK